MLKRNLVICLLLVLSLSVIFFVFYKKNVSSIVYVNSNELFTEFKMTKELKLAGEKEIRLKNSQIDSLRNLVSLTSDESSKSVLIEQLINKKQEIAEFENQYTQLNSQKIWSRIAVYSSDYAKLKGYDFILNSNNNQTVLAGNKDKDVTKELLNFINEKYEGF